MPSFAHVRASEESAKQDPLSTYSRAGTPRAVIAARSTPANRTASGRRMTFTPGQVWVVLAPESHASYVNAARV